MRRQEETFTKSHIYLWCRTSREGRRNPYLAFFREYCTTQTTFSNFCDVTTSFFQVSHELLWFYASGVFTGFAYLFFPAQPKVVELSCIIIVKWFSVFLHIFLWLLPEIFFFQNMRLIKERRLENCVQKWFCSTMTRIGIESFKDLQSTHKKKLPVLA